MEPVIISIEGNIGIGKTTLCKKLKEHNFTVCEEPIKNWLETCDKNGKNILDYFYEDIKKYGFMFQCNAFLTKALKLIETIKSVGNKNNLIFVERCVFTDYKCFARNLYKTGEMEEIEWKVYKKFFKYIISKTPPKCPLPNGYIYLRSENNKILIDRIAKRGRESEKSIPVSYLDSLNVFHDKWLNKKDKNILIIDCSEEETDEYWNDIIEKIVNWTNNLEIKEKYNIERKTEKKLWDIYIIIGFIIFGWFLYLISKTSENFSEDTISL